jgi:hypothetical protein
MRQVTALPLVGPFADRLLAHDLPDLPRQPRSEAVAFVAHRVDTLPSFTRIGVLAIAAGARLLLALPGGWVIIRCLMRLPLPLVGEYPRLVRSLAFAFVWEQWPDTACSGAMPTGGAR